METRENNSENLVYRYNRASRLEHAPDSVKSYYFGEKQYFEKGFFKRMFQNKSTRFSFAIVFILMIFSFVYTKIGPKDNIIQVDDIKVELSSVVLEDKIYCSLLIPSSENFGINQSYISAKFIAFDSNDNVINEKQDVGIYSGEKTYLRGSFSSFEVKKIVCEFEFYDNIYILKSNIK